MIKAGVFPITRLERPAEQGLSRGRNVGWRAASGEYVCFPDDDCWYDPDFLEYSARQLAETGADVLTGRAAKEDGTSINGRFAPKAIWVTAAHQVWTTQIEWVAFFRRSLLVQLGGYDEDVGIGALTPWQACEGQDIVLRALELGARCYYDPSLTGRHAEIVLDRPSASTRKKSSGLCSWHGTRAPKTSLWESVAVPLLGICRPSYSRRIVVGDCSNQLMHDTMLSSPWGGWRGQSADRPTSERIEPVLWSSIADAPSGSLNTFAATTVRKCGEGSR